MKRLPLLVVALAVVAAACGDSGSGLTSTTATTPPPGATTAPVTTAPAAPATFTGIDGVASDVSDTSRIVSLNGDLTEIIFELGAGDRVAGIDVTTTFPPEALQRPVVGFGQQLAAEGVLAFGPTLVIGDQTIAPSETIEQLRGAGVPVVILETQTTFAGVAVKIAQVAEILGLAEAGEALAARVNAEIAVAQTLADQATTRPTVAYVYVRGPQVLLFFGQGMPTQALIEGAGAVDASVAAGIFGPAPVSAEALAAAAPDVIVLPEAGVGALGGIDAFAQVPGVAQTPAGASGSFLIYEEAYFFNLGPRVGQALGQFVLDLYPELSEYG